MSSLGWLSPTDWKPERSKCRTEMVAAPSAATLRGATPNFQEAVFYIQLISSSSEAAKPENFKV